jgi:hypothetical protein
MSTYDGPPLLESMARHSTALWICLGDERGPTRLVPIYEPCSYRELVIRGFMIVTETYRDGGVYTYRPSRAEAEARADDELAFRAMGNAVQGCAMYPKPLGEFAPRRRLILEESDILRMFGEPVAA